MSKSAMTPSFSGRMAWMWPGVRPIIRFASAPTASGRPSFTLIATTEGSFRTMPRPRTYTRVLAVPRSTAMSRPTIDEYQGSDNGGVPSRRRSERGDCRGLADKATGCQALGPAPCTSEAGEEELDLTGCRFGRIGAVDQVLGVLDGQVAADRARRGFLRVGRPHHRAEHRLGIRPLDHHRHERAARDERDEVLEERLAVVLAVVDLRDVDLERAQLQGHDRQVAGLDARDDLADELALDRVGLAEDEGPVRSQLRAHRARTIAAATGASGTRHEHRAGRTDGVERAGHDHLPVGRGELQP